MIELPCEKPLRRAIPGTPYYVELYGGHFTIKVKGSRRPGVMVNWMRLLGTDVATMPDDRPAKIGKPLEYLRWVAEKIERRKAKRK